MMYHIVHSQYKIGNRYVKYNFVVIDTIPAHIPISSFNPYTHYFKIQSYRYDGELIEPVSVNTIIAYAKLTRQSKLVFIGQFYSSKEVTNNELLIRLFTKYGIYFPIDDCYKGVVRTINHAAFMVSSSGIVIPHLGKILELTEGL